MKETLEATTYLLNYLTTHPNAVLQYHSSGMVLCVHSDASYLTETKARLQVGGHFYLSTLQSDTNQPPTTDPPLNGPILSECLILQQVVSSPAEAKIAGVFTNAKKYEIIFQVLIKMGHPQPPTPIQADNTTARDVITNAVK